MSNDAAIDKQSFLNRAGQWITKIRIFLVNSFFVLATLFILAALVSSCESESVPKDSALFINPTGQLVEQTSPPLSFPDVLFQSGQVEETAINDVLEAITLAATDDDIKLIVLDLDDLTYASSAQVLRIGAALDRFKDSGKEIISYEDNFQQFQYHIASYANQLYMHPWGDALLTGYGGNTLYFREILLNL